MTKDHQEKHLNTFKVMIKTLDEEVCQSCFCELYNELPLKSYIDNEDKPILNFIAKSHISGFNGGYQSSSISESYKKTASLKKNLL